jgi:hypothetical protein
MQNDTTHGQPLPMTGTIDSRIGPLGFEGGYPAEESVGKLYDELDFQRAVQVDTTPYVVGFLNLQRTGPLVIDYPKGQTAGGILDFWQRPTTDLGLTGPDKGEGGRGPHGRVPGVPVRATRKSPQDAHHRRGESEVERVARERHGVLAAARQDGRRRTRA